MENLETKVTKEKKIKSNLLKGKDIINIAIFTVLICIVEMVVETLVMVILGMKIAMIMGVGLASLVTMGIYMLMSAKVKKPGVLLFHATLIGLIYTIMSTPVMLLIFVVPGVIGELVVSLPKKNESLVFNSISFGILTLFNSIHGVLVVFILGENARKMMEQFRDKDEINIAFNYAKSVPLILLALGTTVVLCTIGYFIGKKLLKRNFEKAGVI